MDGGGLAHQATTHEFPSRGVAGVSRILLCHLHQSVATDPIPQTSQLIQIGGWRSLAEDRYPPVDQRRDDVRVGRPGNPAEDECRMLMSDERGDSEVNRDLPALRHRFRKLRTTDDDSCDAQLLGQPRCQLKEVLGPPAAPDEAECSGRGHFCRPSTAG